MNSRVVFPAAGMEGPSPIVWKHQKYNWHLGMETKEQGQSWYNANKNSV